MQFIGIYNGPGVNYELTIKKFWLQFKNLNILNYFDFTKKEILNKYNIVILPGGSGTKISNGLGLKGRNNLIKWVLDGGIIIGVCAGFYAMLKGYENSLNLLNYKIKDKPYWRRGKHFVDLKLTKEGKKFFNVKSDIFLNVPYHNGPVVEKINIIDSNIYNEKILAFFNTELVAEGSTKKVMKDSPAIIMNNYGHGYVIAISVHFEQSQIYVKIIEKMINNLYRVEFF